VFLVTLLAELRIQGSAGGEDHQKIVSCSLSLNSEANFSGLPGSATQKARVLRWAGIYIYIT
jgi:hypothetical protein